MEKFDFHIHSDMSDGTFPPEALPELAAARGIKLMAITDHDTASGAARAVAAGKQAGVQVIAGMEIDAEFRSELHILALGIDPECDGIQEYQRWRRAGRMERNEQIIKKLDAIGVYVRDLIEHSKGSDTRLHIALALVKGGYAKTVDEAFARYLSKGAPAHVPGVRIGRREAIELAGRAGGVAALAHPCKINADVNKLVNELTGYGMWGIEAFYPASTKGQRNAFLSMAARYGLAVTCGSDFHGANRDVELGCAYESHPALERAYDMFCRRTLPPAKEML